MKQKRKTESQKCRESLKPAQWTPFRSKTGNVFCRSEHLKALFIYLFVSVCLLALYYSLPEFLELQEYQNVEPNLFDFPLLFIIS